MKMKCPYFPTTGDFARNWARISAIFFFIVYQTITNVYGMLSADTEETNWISGPEQIITGVFCK